MFAVRRRIKRMKYLVALLAVVGIVVSAMALHVHYMDPAAAPPCAVTEKFDCGAVNHSRFAVFPPRTFDEDPKAKVHIPIAALGIAGYAAIGVLALVGWWWERMRLLTCSFDASGGRIPVDWARLDECSSQSRGPLRPRPGRNRPGA